MNAHPLAAVGVDPSGNRGWTLVTHVASDGVFGEPLQGPRPLEPRVTLVVLPTRRRGRFALQVREWRPGIPAPLVPWQSPVALTPPWKSPIRQPV